MKRIVYISFIASLALNASDVSTLEEVRVVEKANSILLKDISSEELKSADLAQALGNKIPSISIVRRNAISNDIILRGQKKDNINILIDEAKIHGACPNRMDPPTSHVLTNNIESVKVIEGPYDVENFGTLSGLIKVKTKEPKEGIHGEINLNAGSFAYRKASATISGGNDFVKALISASTEKGKAYKDGNGDNFLEQQKKKNVQVANQYTKDDLNAFEKKSVLTKLQFNLTDDQDVKLSYTGNRSDDVLYPNTPMDADFDDSDIYTLGYTVRNLGDFSKQLDLEYYYSKVDHPMSTKYRNSGKLNYNTNHMKSSIWGAKVKNSLEIGDSLLTLGLDTSVRNWRGQRSTTNTITGLERAGMFGKKPDGTMGYIPSSTSLDSTDTTNKAIFSKLEKSFGKLDLELGARYDYTNIETEKTNTNERKYASLNGYIYSQYNVDEESKVFAGIGKSSRVPDARELYMGNTSNEKLEDTKNYEADIGFEKTIGGFNIKPKLFYSVLKDYIYNSSKFENIDAKIYGLDISGYYYITDNFSLDYGTAYQRGKKSGNHTDKDLAEIPPLKANFALNYEYKKSKYTAELLAVNKWKNFDKEAKEQKLPGYALINLKYSNELIKNFTLTVGVDNVFDKNYASSNTYQDLTYVEAGGIGGERVLLNDPGRYGYVNLRYSF